MIRSNIAVFHELPANVAGTRYAAVPLKDQHGSLEHKSYERLIKNELEKKGMLEAAVEDADVILFISYGIDTGKETVTSYPIIGRTGTASTYTSGTVTAYGNSASYSGTTYSRPTYGVVGTGVSSDTEYTRFLHLDFLEKSALMNGVVRKLYEAKVISSGSSGQLAVVMPTLVSALFEEFPGKSGSTRRVTLPMVK